MLEPADRTVTLPSRLYKGPRLAVRIKAAGHLAKCGVIPSDNEILNVRPGPIVPILNALDAGIAAGGPARYGRFGFQPAARALRVLDAQFYICPSFTAWCGVASLAADRGVRYNKYAVDIVAWSIRIPFRPVSRRGGKSVEQYVRNSGRVEFRTVRDRYAHIAERQTNEGSNRTKAAGPAVCAVLATATSVALQNVMRFQAMKD